MPVVRLAFTLLDEPGDDVAQPEVNRLFELGVGA